jgi:glycosyltransferase involved in cell wall biosynthesis
MSALATVAAVVPAKDEAERIAATVRAVRGIPGVDVVVVVDDGSRDETARLAREAGAVVARHHRNRGKAAAMTTGAAVVAERDRARAVAHGPASGLPPHHLLFVDADLQYSAAQLGALVAPVADGDADMTIAVLPPQASAAGHGFVVRLARGGIRQLTGWDPAQPLSGMRCLTRPAFAAATPLARGWGVETGLTIDVLSQGLRVLEVPCELHHRATGRDWRGQLHRAAQYRDVWLALAARRFRRRRA